MKLEHLALNVPDPVAMAEWYCAHLGFTVKRRTEGPPFARFLCEAGGGVMLEIYHNNAVEPPDYGAMNKLTIHLAFQSDDVEADRAKLLAAGAKAEGGIDRDPNGDLITMLRDPWGVCIQIVKRTEPMITGL